MAYCNACGTEVPEGARFCQNCGANLTPADGGPVVANPAMATQAVYPPLFAPAYGPTSPLYPPPPYAITSGAGYAVTPSKSGKAVAGFWIGIASIPCFVLSWIGIIIGILGLIFGLIGLSEARRIAAMTGESPLRYGQRQAWIGIVCAIAGIIASAAFLVYLLNNLEKYGIKISG